MGLRLQHLILALLRTVFGSAFWPKIDTNASVDNVELLWPELLSRMAGKMITAIDDMNGTIRGLLLGSPDSRARWNRESKDMEARAKAGIPAPVVTAEDEEEEGADQNIPSTSGGGGGGFEEEPDLDAPDSIERPSDLKRYLFERYWRQILVRGITTLHCVWDFLERTPRIKGIMAPKRFHRPVLWPAKIDRRYLFKSDLPFQNTIHEYVMDKEAKELLYEYVTEALFDEFPRSNGGLPEGISLVVWGGVYKGTRFEVPMTVYRTGRAMADVCSPTPLQSFEGLEVLCAEADLTIGAIVRYCIGRCTVVVLSRDTDFLPILIGAYAEALHAFVTTDGAPDPRQYGVFISRKQMIKYTEEAETTPTTPAAEQQHQQQQQQPLQTEIDPEQLPFASSSSLEDEDEEDNLSWLKPPPPPPVKHIPSIFKKPPPAAAFKAPAAKGRAKKAAEPKGIQHKHYIREIIDIGDLCQSAWPIFYEAHSRCAKCNPLDALIVIMYLCGCDYFRKPPFIVFKDLLAAYIKHNKKIGCLCPRDTSPDDLFRINYGAFTRLLSIAYCTKHKVTLDTPFNYGAVSTLLRKRKIAADADTAEKEARKAERGEPLKVRKRAPADRLPPEKPQGYGKRLHFTANYYRRRAKHAPFNGLEKDVNGKSFYGYTTDKNNVCMFTDDVTISEVF